MIIDRAEKDASEMSREGTSITRSDASSVFIANSQLRDTSDFKRFRIKRFYVGSPAYEGGMLVSGQILKLSREHVEAALEGVLSGE
jgi:hypothetical protein